MLTKEPNVTPNSDIIKDYLHKFYPDVNIKKPPKSITDVKIDENSLSRINELFNENCRLNWLLLNENEPGLFKYIFGEQDLPSRVPKTPKTKAARACLLGQVKVYMDQEKKWAKQTKYKKGSVKQLDLWDTIVCIWPN